MFRRRHEPHTHILRLHCRDGNCQWFICVVCNGYGTLGGDGRWAVNPYKFTTEPHVSSS
jgi:hypothetical protein